MGPSITESLDPAVLSRTLDSLFPGAQNGGSSSTPAGVMASGSAIPETEKRRLVRMKGNYLSGVQDGGPSSGPAVMAMSLLDNPETERITLEEVKGVIRRKGGNVAPGDDGLCMRAIRSIQEPELQTLADCFTQCIREGRFPTFWKHALLVLIPKGWPLDSTNPRLRPICLLSESGKIFETVLADRLIGWGGTRKQNCLQGSLDLGVTSQLATP